MIKIDSHGRLFSAMLGISALLACLFAMSTAQAKQYKISDLPAKKVDLRVSGDHVTGFEILARHQCRNQKGSAAYSTRGKAFSPADAPFRKRLDSMGRFAFRVKLNFRGEFVETTVIKGRVGSDKIRGGFSIKSFPDKEGLIDTCWTGKSRSNPWVKFVAPAR